MTRAPLMLRNGSFIGAAAVFALTLVQLVRGDQGVAKPAETIRVCGTVQAFTCDDTSRRTKITLKPRPRDLQVVILGTDREAFPVPPEEAYEKAQICATGSVEPIEGRRTLLIRRSEDVVRAGPPAKPSTLWALPHYRPCDPGIQMPVLVHEVHPEYTSTAMRAKIQGVVTFEGIVGADGILAGLRLTKSLDAELDRQAVTALREWRFKPGTRFGQPAPVLVDIEMSFRLK